MKLENFHYPRVSSLPTDFLMAKVKVIWNSKVNSKQMGKKSYTKIQKGLSDKSEFSRLIKVEIKKQKKKPFKSAIKTKMCLKRQTAEMKS